LPPVYFPDGGVEKISHNKPFEFRKDKNFKAFRHLMHILRHINLLGYFNNDNFVYSSHSPTETLPVEGIPKDEWSVGKPYFEKAKRAAFTEAGRFEFDSKGKRKWSRQTYPSKFKGGYKAWIK